MALCRVVKSLFMALCRVVKSPFGDFQSKQLRTGNAATEQDMFYLLDYVWNSQEGLVTWDMHGTWDMFYLLHVGHAWHMGHVLSPTRRLLLSRHVLSPTHVTCCACRR
jgi:hypothetical protein